MILRLRVVLRLPVVRNWANPTKEPTVPLSEDEQRILSEIEDHLYESDPSLAREVAQTTIYTHAFRNLKRATVGFIAGTVAMVALLSVSFVFSFVGVLIMLFSPCGASTTCTNSAGRVSSR